MNIITDGLPDQFEGYPIMPDFRNMIRFELLINESKTFDEVTAYISLSLLYPIKDHDGHEYLEMPDDINKALDGLLWFYSRGRYDPEKQDKKSADPAYDFDQDCDDIISAFMECYGINLTRAPLNSIHWWEFLALLWGLPSTTTIREKMYIRTVDINSIKDKYEKQRVQKLRSLYAIKRNKIEDLTKESIEKSTLEWADKILPREVKNAD